MFNYETHAKADSMYNTPATYSWYMAGLVFDWIKQQGGLSKIAEINERKAAKLYAAIDGSDFYANPVTVNCRSIMNVPFTLADAELDSVFLAEAKEQNLVTLKGHRSVGGMRASIYNAMPEEGVDALVAFMAEFISLSPDWSVCRVRVMKSPPRSSTPMRYYCARLRCMTWRSPSR
jgi:phosphoserine aminotransferase